MKTLVAWSTVHRRVVVAVWVLAVAVSLGIWLGVGSRYANDFHLPRTDSQRARDLVAAAFPSRAGDQNQLVFHARQGTLVGYDVRRQVERLLARVDKLDGVSAVSRVTVSRDRTIGFATVILERRSGHIKAGTLHRLAGAVGSARSPALQIELGGPSVEQASQTAVGSSMVIGLCTAVVVLLLAFGSVAAMGLPILTALAGIGAGIGLVALVSRLVVTPTFSEELALMIGLGVGVDYALFVVTRYREAYRANGGDVEAAVAVALNTAGRAVLFAGLTVVVSLLGMSMLRISFLYGLAITSSLTVLLVLAASVTLLPAVIAGAGHRIGRVGAVAMRFARPQHLGAWHRWISLIQRRPWVAAVGAATAMTLLTLPLVGLRLGNADAGNDPPSSTTRRAYDLLARGFGPGFNGPLLIAVRLPAAGSRAVLARLEADLRRTDGVATVGTPLLGRSGRTSMIVAVPTSSPQSSATAHLIARLRTEVFPPLAATTGAAIYVGGFTAVQVDFAHVIAAKLWLFVAAVTFVAAAFLLVVFRSFAVPLQAALMNLLSIGSSLGVVVAVFQWGWLNGLLHVNPAPIQPFLPVMVFAIVFGLSMDYEIFLVSRIHESWVHGSSPGDAVRHGIVQSARIVTAAAAVMIAVFASFMLAGDSTIRPFGLGLASAVLLDAIVVRCLFLPAALELLGRWTWWFPAALDRRLPRLALEPPDHDLEAPLRAA